MEQELIQKKEIVSSFLERGILLSKDFFEIGEFELNSFLDHISSPDFKDLLVIDKVLFPMIRESSPKGFNFIELEKSKVLKDKEKDSTSYNKFISFLRAGEKNKADPQIKILFSYDKESKDYKLGDFVSYFRKRYDSIKNFLLNRNELANAISISRITNKKERDNVALIGLVYEKSITSNNNIMLTLEDNSGQIKVLVNQNKPEIYQLAKNIVLDEVIGVVGVNGNNIVFANNVLLPEIPLSKELKKSPKEEYAVFLSDLHVGSDHFLTEDFSNFLKWIKGEFGSPEQREISSKIGYVLIVGDIVDGVGIYPDQDLELDIPDIFEQYKKAAELIRQIPQHIKIIICPGNHDAMRISEPQLKLYEEFCPDLFALPNVTLVSNPALVNIGFSNEFPGFDILLYHGYSFDHYVSEVEAIRAAGGYDKADAIMKFLLQKRHLAPAYSSTLSIPDCEEDPLVIDKIPDIFITGHIHKCSAANYRNITVLSGSCWQSKTPFQEKVGHNPEPSRVPVVNLKTRKIKILKFSS